MWCGTNSDSDYDDTPRRSMVDSGNATRSEKRGAETPCSYYSPWRKVKKTRATFVTTDDKNNCNINEQDVDAVVNLAEDLNELTFQEREKVMEEVHGVGKIPEETPEFVASSLAALDVAINLVPKRKRRAMEKAYFLRPSFATDDQFKLLFLRAEEFDATAAATRMVAYFEAKRTLFGDAKLGKKRVTLDDLSPGDIQTTFYSEVAELPKCGKRQYLDASGRPILYCNLPKLGFDNLHGVARGVWYIAMSMILPEDDDEEASTATAASIKGICLLCHIPPNSVFQSSLPKIIDGCHQANVFFVDCLPYRFTSLHYCYNNPAMRTVISIMQKFLGKRARVRMRMHAGSPVEIRYTLLPFGIRCPPNVVRIAEEPQSSTATSNYESEMNEYLENRKEIERRLESTQLNREIESGILLYPRNCFKDVLIGRGQSYKDHPGNLLYQGLIDSKLEEYSAATDNFAKTCISMNVVQTIQDAGGRFLINVGGKGWKILESSIARDKTSASFRAKIANKQKITVY